MNTNNENNDIISKIKNFFKRSDFSKNVLTLFSGTLLARLIIILSLPILTRLYPKEVIGLFISYSVIVMILSVISTLQYDMAIVLTESTKDRINIVVLSLIVTTIFSLFLFLFFYFFYDEFTSLLFMMDKKSIGKWFYAVPISVFLVGIFQTLTYWNSKKSNFKILSKARISKSIFTVLFQFSFLNILLNGGMIFGLIIGQFSSSVFLLVKSFKEIFIDNYRSIKLNLILKLAIKYRRIAIYNTLISSLNMISVQLPVILLGRFFGMTATASYGIAHQTVSGSMGLISSSISDVFYPKVSTKLNNAEDIRSFIIKTYKAMFKIGIIPFILLFIFAPFLFQIFGEDYIEAGRITQIMTPWLFLMFLNNPITRLVTVLKKQTFSLKYDLLLALFRFLSLYLGFKIFNDLYISILLFSIVGVIFNIFFMLYFLKVTKNIDSKNLY